MRKSMRLRYDLFHDIAYKRRVILLDKYITDINSQYEGSLEIGTYSHPVQIEGTICGKFLTYYAKYNNWFISLSAYNKGYNSYNDGRYKTKYQSAEEIRDIIMNCIKERL